MPSSFPGVDPYLEGPTYWAGFHAKFIVHISDAIVAQLPSGYYAGIPANLAARETK